MLKILILDLFEKTQTQQNNKNSGYIKEVESIITKSFLNSYGNIINEDFLV
jgi:hypothetical protein